MGGKDLSRERLEELVAWQLDREPAIAFSVAVWCPYGWPAVLRNAAYTEAGEPNPNLYYLSCPYLRTVISRLEDEGRIKQIQEQVASDELLRAALDEAQEQHGKEWLAAAAEQSPAVGPTTKAVYISGAGKKEYIKCLHGHFAYYLVHPDHAVGILIEKLISDIWCRDERCAAWG